MKHHLKSFFAFTTVIVLVLSLAACGTSTPSGESTSDASLSAKVEEEIVSENKFQQFEKALTDKGIAFDVNPKSAALVGATEGYGYIFGDETSVELYLFDTSTDTYKEASANSKLSVAAFGISMDVVFNKDICIYYNGTPSAKNDIETIFNNLK